MLQSAPILSQLGNGNVDTMANHAGILNTVLRRDCLGVLLLPKSATNDNWISVETNYYSKHYGIGNTTVVSQMSNATREEKKYILFCCVRF